MGRMKRAVTGLCGIVRGRRLGGSSLLETIVASVVFLTSFVSVMELLPHLATDDRDALLSIEAESRLDGTCDEYASGLWPCGEYVERYGWGEIVVSVEECRKFADMQTITVRARIYGRRDAIECRRIVKRAP